ncbi:unnamed protein product [Rotaria sp. Silwood1]|nr:unnamed protein product [Rotaria sp. Silwood1]CAF4816592.1 unnamed protein product [Rotaria sp. Silwood1]
MRSTSDDEIDQQLIDHYEDFQENLYRIQNMNNTIDFQWISLLVWLKYYAQIYAIALNNEIQHSQQNLRLPIPLFECREEFQRFNQILHQNDKIDDLRQLVHECNRSQNLSYSFLCWFIQYYCHFMQVNSKANEKFVHLIENDLQQEIIESFTWLDSKLLIFLYEQQYSLLNFFNVTTFYKLDPLDEFIFKIQSIPYTENTYPITAFILQHLDDYSNIQHTYPIIIFTNYLIEKFNYRINRNDATEKKILCYLTKDKDKHRTNQLYNDFLHA